jgi:hypothetical protein
MRSTSRLSPATTPTFSTPWRLQPDLAYTDVWTDPTKARRAADASLTIDYLSVPSTERPVNGVIDYETSIAPIWARARTFPNSATVGTCTTCHDGSGTGVDDRHALDLRNTTGGAGRQASYDSLLIGDPQLDANGLPVLTVDNGEIKVVESEAQVVPGLARGSHLIEELFNQELKSDYTLGTTVNHAGLLNASELRLVSEWIDLGAQYYNSPRDGGGNLRGVSGMDQAVFDNSIHAILLNRCGSCHQPVGVAGTTTGTTNTGFVGRRFVLTGDPEGDFNVTLSMVGDVCQPAQSELLRRPASTGTNPTHGVTPSGGPILSTTPTPDPDYVAIYNWISAAGTTCP